MAWTDIVVTQVPNWGIIPNSTVSGDTAFQADAFQNDAFQIFYASVWADIDDTQAPNWGSITNSQTSGWTPVTTPPAITWTQI